VPEGKSSNRDQLHAGINNKLHDFTPVRDVFQLNTTLCHVNCLTEDINVMPSHGVTRLLFMLRVKMSKKP